MIAIHYFANIREELGCEQEQFELPEGVEKIDQLIDCLIKLHGEPWADVLGNKSLMIAINHEMVDRSAALGSGDEVAFFPPVTGG